MAKTSEKSTGAIVEEATDWLVRLQDPTSGLQDAAEFTDWLHRSPVHVREYLRAESTWADLANVDPERCIDVAALLREGDSNVVALRSATPDSSAVGRPASFRMWLSGSVAAAAAIVALLIGSLAYLEQTEALVYKTGRGEQRHLVLADGSIIDMNTQSEIRVRMGAAERYIDFVRGEALFTVSKDEDRPFVVKSDLALVRALGTQFNVYRLSGQVLVTVLEGRVAVENTTRISDAVSSAANAGSARNRSVELVAGDQAEVAAKAAIRTASANMERTIAWRERRLIFEDQPLSEVIAEFNRYNNLQLIVDDPNLSVERISAVFDVDQPDALVRFLAQSIPIKTVRTSRSELVIRIRK